MPTNILKHFKHKIAVEISSIAIHTANYAVHVSIRNKTMSSFNKNQLLPLDNSDLILVANYKWKVRYSAIKRCIDYVCSKMKFRGKTQQEKLANRTAFINKLKVKYKNRRPELWFNPSSLPDLSMWKVTSTDE